MAFSKTLNRLLKGYISAIVAALLVRLLQLYRNQRKLLELNSNLVKGKHFILGNLREFEADRLHFIHSLFQSSSNDDVKSFIYGGPVSTLFSVRSKVAIERLLQDVVVQVGSTPDVKVAHDTVVGASLHHIRNWDQGSVCLFDEFTELLSKVLCHIFLKSKLWQAQYGEIRNALLSEKSSRTDEWKLIIEALKGKSSGDFSKASAASRSKQLAKLAQVLSTLPENPKVKTTASDEETALPSNEDLAFQLWESFHLTRSILTWSCTNLALYSSYQEDLAKEIDGLVGRRVPPMVQEMRFLVQLDAVIQETLRLRSPVPLGYAKAQDTLVVGDLSLPKSSQVVLAIGLANTSPQLFDQANEFIPSRTFEDDFKAKCIAPPSAMLNVSLVVAKALLVVILQKYRITLDQSHPVSLDPVLLNNFSVPDKNLACLFETRKIGSTL